MNKCHFRQVYFHSLILRNIFCKVSGLVYEKHQQEIYKVDVLCIVKNDMG